MKKVLAWIRHELVSAVPAAAYFFVAFQIIAFTDALLLEDYGIDMPTFALATVAALVAAKVVLIIDAMPLANRFAQAPLVYGIAWKSLLFIAVVAAFKYLEHLLPLLQQHRGFVAAHQGLWEEIEWPRLAAATIWLVVLFSVFAAVRELGRVLGRERLRHIFLAPPEAPCADGGREAKPAAVD